MKNIKILFIAFLLIIVPATGYNQECTDFIKSKVFRQNYPKGFELYGQSKSAYVEVRKILKYNILFFGDKEYQMTIGTEIVNRPIHIRMIDAGDNTVLFDNVKNMSLENINFYIENTKNIIVEITILSDTETYLSSDKIHVCLGIKITSHD